MVEKTIHLMAAEKQKERGCWDPNILFKDPLPIT
jgi:hypothetical protein